MSLTAFWQSLLMVQGLHIFSMLKTKPSLFSRTSTMKALLELMERREALALSQLPLVSLPTAARPAKPIDEQKEASTLIFMVPRGRGPIRFRCVRSGWLVLEAGREVKKSSTELHIFSFHLWGGQKALLSKMM